MECAEGDADTLISRIDRFLCDDSAGAITGIRRMGREALVIMVASRARDRGYTVCFDMDGTADPDFVILSDRTDVQEAHAMYPGAQVLYGQDLCHQVPAVVRSGMERDPMGSLYIPIPEFHMR